MHAPALLDLDAINLEKDSRMTETNYDVCDRTLFRRAVGFDYPSTQSVLVNGAPVHVPIAVTVPPDTGACIEWLTRRRPDRWRR
jgi:hypothetical protein